MAAPVITNVSLDKASYAPGETAVLTFDATDPDTKTLQVTIKVSDNSGASGTQVVDLVVTDPLSATVTDTDGRVWTHVSTVGTTQTWSATV